ncbi:hypothetical protein D3C75_672510 [compost metagenome]
MLTVGAVVPPPPPPPPLPPPVVLVGVGVGVGVAVADGVGVGVTGLPEPLGLLAAEFPIIPTASALVSGLLGPKVPFG